MDASDSILLAFKALSDNELYLTIQSFIKNMKKFKITLFSNLTSDMGDYESCCGELFQSLILQCDYNSSPIKVKRNSISNLPKHLQFVMDSKENPLTIEENYYCKSDEEKILSFIHFSYVSLENKRKYHHVFS